MWIAYGGSTETDTNPIFGVDYMKKIYLEGGYSQVIKETHLWHNLVKGFELVQINKIRLLLRCCKKYLLLLLHPCVGNFTAA